MAWKKFRINTRLDLHPEVIEKVYSEIAEIDGNLRIVLTIASFLDLMEGEFIRGRGCNVIRPKNWTSGTVTTLGN